MLPSPAQLIDAPKFDHWFPGQEELVMKVMAWLQGDKRFLCANVPTGFGKSIVAIIAGHLSGRWKIVYLTYTKGLQYQLMADFDGPVQMHEIRGQSNYECMDAPPARVDEGKCHAGETCDLKSVCSYYHALQFAKWSRFTNTNYSYWLAQNYYGDGLLPKNELDEVEGTYPLVVMDEAHLAGRALEQHLTVNLGEMDFSVLGWEMEEMQAWTWEQWQLKCKYKEGELNHEASELAKEMKDHTASRGERRRYKMLKNLELQMKAVGTAEIEWVREWGGSSVSLCPVWPSHYNGRLFIGDKILLMSGTLTRKSVEKLGIKEEECEWIDSPSPFDPANSPITQINIGFRVEYKTPPENMEVWARVIDQIVEKQGDRKGILFTVSYPRSELFYRLSGLPRSTLVTHHRRNTLERVEYFKKSRGPKLLVSPSVTSGWDFPDTECEYIIIGKVPFVTATGELTKARQKEDKEWVHFLAMETIVQEAGRGTRKMSDHCEVFVVDDHFSWFWPKYKHFSPRWFQDRVKKSVSSVPDRR